MENFQFNTIQSNIIEEVFFLTAYSDIQKKTHLAETDLNEALEGLLQQGALRQFIFQEEMKDYVEMLTPNVLLLKHSSFLATKEALLKYTLG